MKIKSYQFTNRRDKYSDLRAEFESNLGTLISKKKKTFSMCTVFLAPKRIRSNEVESNIMTLSRFASYC